jgi:hypothetical protein
MNVNIFIIVYREPTIALTLDSYYTKLYLEQQMWDENKIENEKKI